MREAVAVIVDLDGTLAQMVHRRELFAVFAHNGLSLSRAGRIYKRVRNTVGFSLPHMLRAIKEEGYRLDRESTTRDFIKWLRSSLTLYRDVGPFIRAVRAQRIPFIILTLGEEQFQRQKVEMSGIRPDKLIVAGSPHEKVEKLRRVVQERGRPLVCVDDDPRILDAVARELPPYTVIPVRLQRGPYQHLKVRRSHWTIRSLLELPLLSNGRRK